MDVAPTVRWARLEPSGDDPSSRGIGGSFARYEIADDKTESLCSRWRRWQKFETLFETYAQGKGVEASGREDEKEEPVVGSSREKEKRNGEKVSKVLRKKMTISQSPALYRVTSRERLERRYV
ncbi:uncharacterized protein LOC143153105 isoform X3 [Ptiloglossa arizonensis]|uniref:uncharacterized protein LOC143153105 isoform X3 n=1 Tax=Ptiloglossa arizonensis TaxID=3350558 RepID=UPI003F9EFCD4